MSDALATYLHDHFAGSNFAVELLEFLRDQHAGQRLGDAAAGILAEVEEDRKVLQGIIGRVGNGVPILKEASAWIGEKLSELKLRQGAFGTFEALEGLALGILGKVALWRALADLAETDPSSVVSISTCLPRALRDSIRERKNSACNACELHLRSRKATVAGSVAN